MTTSVRPILVIERFAPLREKLVELFDALSDDDWVHPTAAGKWSVKDVAAHLLGGDLGILSRKRDAHQMPAVVIRSYGDLIDLVNRLNSEWVVASRRMSPRVLRELLEFTGPQVEAYFASVDPFAMGEPVSWAGPEPAPVWMDLAREFTERWHHQQQIRDAVGREPLYDPFYMSPVLEAFVMALPFNFRDQEAPDGTAVRFEISGGSGGVWFVVRTSGGWGLLRELANKPAADVVLPQDTAWRMFTKGVSADAARAAAMTHGDQELASPIFRTISIIG